MINIIEKEIFRLRKYTISGLRWTSLGKILRQVIQFTVLVILSRLIEPVEFGLFGMVIVFTGFANIIRNFGLGTAIIQKSKVNNIQLSTIFWMNLGFGVLLCVFFIICSGYIAKFYNQPQLKLITIIISIDFIFSSSITIQDSLLRKNLDFIKLFVVEITAVTVAGITAVVLAFKGYGVWSLVVQNLTITIMTMILIWIIVGWMPLLIFKFREIKKLFSFGANLTGFNVINYFSRNIDNLLIGKILGPFSLGIYSRAYQLMLLPVSEVNQILTKVMFPSLSTIQDDKYRIKSIYLKATRLIAFITFPTMIIVAILSKRIILILYGNTWIDVAPVLAIFSFYGMSQSITTTIGWIFNSLGKPNILLKLSLYNTTISFVAIIIGLRWGILGVALSYTLASYFFLLYPNWRIAFRLIELGVKDMILNLQKIIFCTIILGCVVLFLQEIVLSVSEPILTVFVSIAVGIPTYLVLIKIIYSEILIELKEMLR